MFERTARPLAGLAGWMARVVDGTYRILGRPGKLLQDLLNGTWIGHALHPLITDVVVGGATAAVLLVVLGWFGIEGLSTATTWILGLTALAALAAIVSGLTDFKDTFGDEQNVAALHGVLNIVGTLGLIVAFVADLADAGGAMTVVLLVSYEILAIGAFIGGHLVFKFGSMVNYNAFSGGRRAREFTRVAEVTDVPEETPTKAMLGTTGLVVVRRGDLVYALKDTCSHAGTPLSKGHLEGDGIVCPQHGSVFRLSDGAVRHGPATTRQVRYLARISEGGIEVEGPLA